MKVFVVAGELSGDALGASLMDGLKELVPGVTFEGIGGPQMTASGLTSLFAMDELSVMGLAEILPKYPQLKRRLNQTITAVLESKPDVLVTIDSPDFGLRVAKAVKAKSTIRTVHYVAPTVWAWRPKRAAKMARFIDHVLALFPFEPPYMQAEGMACDFVGHPIAVKPQASEAEAQAFAQTVPGEGPIVLLLPGSRRGEVSRLLPRFLESLEGFASQTGPFRLVLPTATPVCALIEEMTQDWALPLTVISGQEGAEKRAAFAAADVALAASGTVSLELAAAKTPMVVGYDMAPLSRFIIQKMLRTDTVTLVNLVSETRVVPEFIGHYFVPSQVAAALKKTLDAPQAQQDAMELCMQRLGQGGIAPGLRAAQAILDGLK
ncbi:MAG: lipid-A-disaccharide synthase [Pseudomonadota bacterium]